MRISTLASLFEEKLKQAGLTQTQFRDIVACLTGLEIAAKTTSGWVHGRRTPQAALALVELLSRMTPRERSRLLDGCPDSN